MTENKQKKIEMPHQPPMVRNKNFDEVSLGYTEDMAVCEAKRCLNCKAKPCMKGCPVMVKIPEFIKLISERKFEEAYKKITETSSLPAICGRVCPQENQCEKYCVRGVKGESVAIGRLERFVADWHIKFGDDDFVSSSKKGKSVAVVGSGPSGLACAGDLAKMGYDVTVFEAFHTPGGVLVYGIPEFRLPKSVVECEIEKLKKLGVCFKTNMVIGKVFSIDELMEEGFSAVYVATGAGLPCFMNIEGESLNGVYSANEFLTRINLMKAYKFPEYDTPVYVGKTVAVVGGGNVAMDAARCAKRLGAEKVYVLYRRSMEEMPARREEIIHALEEEIEFLLLTTPVRINGKEGWVNSIECMKMELGEPDSSGRCRPVKIEGSEFSLPVDSVVMAIGQTPNPLIKNTTPDMDFNDKGCIIACKNSGKTSKKGVFAGGDAVTGAATVILGMGAGKNAAFAIDKYLNSAEE